MYRPGGSKGADWNFFFTCFQFFFFLTFPLYILKKKLNQEKKKKIPPSRLAVFLPIRPTGNDFLLKGGLIDMTKSSYKIVRHELIEETSTTNSQRNLMHGSGQRYGQSCFSIKEIFGGSDIHNNRRGESWVIGGGGDSGGPPNSKKGKIYHARGHP